MRHLVRRVLDREEIEVAAPGARRRRRRRRRRRIKPAMAKISAAAATAAVACRGGELGHAAAADFTAAPGSAAAARSAAAETGIGGGSGLGGGDGGGGGDGLGDGPGPATAAAAARGGGGGGGCSGRRRSRRGSSLAEPPTPPTLGGGDGVVATFMRGPDGFSSPNLAPASRGDTRTLADDGSKNSRSGRRRGGDVVRGSPSGTSRGVVEKRRLGDFRGGRRRPPPASRPRPRQHLRSFFGLHGSDRSSTAAAVRSSWPTARVAAPTSSRSRSATTPLTRRLFASISRASSIAALAASKIDEVVGVVHGAVIVASSAASSQHPPGWPAGPSSAQPPTAARRRSRRGRTPRGLQNS